MNLKKALYKFHIISLVIGNFPYNFKPLWESDFLVFFSYFYFNDRLVVPERIYIYFKILIFVHKTVSVLPDRPSCRIGIH